MSKIISKRLLEDIRFANDIVEVIGGYLTLKKAGSAYKSTCPFHKEKTPSFSVNPQRQIFHCFGCGEGGDVFSYVMKYEGVDFVTAAKILAQRAGITLELDDDADEGDGPKKDVLFKIHEEVARFFHRCLMQVASAKDAREYLESRDLGKKAIEDFLIGYAPNRWDSMLRWGEKNKISEDVLEAAGLILKSSKPDAKSKYYDRFRNRLMFPIRDIQRRVIGFSGRVLDKKDPKAAKYVNSPETRLFHKGRILYALDSARRDIVSAEPREAIVCEGQIDVIRCHIAGFTNAVAAQGTAFTEDHARILHRYADSVVIVFDTDTAGEDAAIKAARIFIETGLAVRVARLPKSSDPDTFICEKGAEAFGRVIEKAVSAVGFQMEILSGREKMDSEIGVMRASKAVLETISISPTSVQQAKLLQEAAERLGVPVSALQDDLKKMQRKTTYNRQAEQMEGKADKRVRPQEEVELCEHIVHVADFPEIGKLVKKYLPSEMILDQCCRQTVGAALDSMESGRSIDEELREHYDIEGEMQSFSAAILEAPTKSRGEDLTRTDAVRDLILRIWRREKERERAELQKSDDSLKRRHASEIGPILHRLKKWDDDAVGIMEFELDI